MPAVSAAACCAAATPANEVVEDLFGFLRVLGDGTILRSPAEPVFCPTTFPTSHPSVQWKEAVYDKAKNLRVRRRFGRVFVTGDSAGGTIAHHLAVRAGSAAAEPGETTTTDPVRVLGYVLMMPFFGGVRRTPSEAECPTEAFPNLDLVDRFWRLSLPAGSTRDHPASNPFGPDSPDLSSVDLRPVLVVAGGLDLIRDRTVDYAERLAAMGKPVELAEFAGKAHGFYLHEPGSEATGELIQAVARFVDGCVAATEAAA
ncbi:putative carboxylesterase 15 [Panicum miliaceum]|uniref:Carboxylesterase 15 n=1 Tax=Panicum miliaceum TaxID=4540 RepID=A0A3L6TCR2_PANMI|nr:putative carboxylesterase 15 [Panicum miliaceum]